MKEVLKKLNSSTIVPRRAEVKSGVVVVEFIPSNKFYISLTTNVYTFVCNFRSKINNGYYNDTLIGEISANNKIRFHFLYTDSVTDNIKVYKKLIKNIKVHNQIINLDERYNVRKMYNKPISIHGIVYQNIPTASKLSGISRNTILNRLKLNNFPDYSYVV